MSDRQYSDSVAISLPRAASPIVDGVLDAQRAARVVRHLTSVAAEQLHHDFPHARLLAAEWTFCFTAAEIEAWPLPHICPDCLQCKDLGVALLAEHPDLFVALGHLYCEEPG